MFLKKCIYVNWGNIPNSELEMGPTNLLCGGNGSGKTTAADAIQTVMTAAHDYLFAYNPGQDETTQRGRGGKQVRTLASYVLGCDDGSYARLEPTDGYIAACFHPTQGETAEPFTAVICSRAHLDRSGNRPVARQDELFFLLLPGSTLCLTDLQKTLPDETRLVVPLEKVVSQLQKDHRVERYDTKKAYLKRLYGLLRAKAEVSEREAMNAARTFSRFMAYKPVKSITDFVASEILEPRDLGDAIRTVSDLLKTIHGMEADARRLSDSIALLGRARQSGEDYIQQWISLNQWQYKEARFRYLEDQRQYLAAKRQEKSLRDEQVANQQQRDALEDQQRQLEARRLELTAKRLGYQPLQQKDELETRLQALSRQLQEATPAMLTQSRRLANTFAATDRMLTQLSGEPQHELGQLFRQESLQSAKALQKSKATMNLDFADLLGRDWVDMAPLEQHLADALQVQQRANEWQRLLHDKELSSNGVSLRDQLAQLLHRQENQNQKLEQQHRQKQSEIESLESQQVSYPWHVRQALEAIQRQCPEADPRVLCDYVEVIEPQWQNAIEGYLGGARFGIIVDPDYEARAIQIVRQMKGGSQVRVIQGTKAQKDAERMKLSKNSVIHIMEFGHATARHYLVASYGSVERVDSEETLRMTRRGITQAGLGSGSYSLWRCDMDDSDLVFGSGARDKARHAKLKELENLQRDVRDNQANWESLHQLLKDVDTIQPLDYAEQLSQLLELHRTLRETETRLAELDLSDFATLEEELGQLQAESEALKIRIQELLERKGSLTHELKKASEQCRFFSDRKDSSEIAQDEHEANLRSITRIWPEFDPEAALEQADAEVEKLSETALQKALQDTRNTIDALAHQFESGLMEHNRASHTVDQIPYMPDYSARHQAVFFESICTTCKDIDQVHNRLKNNILVEKQDKLGNLKETFNNTFVTHLCHAIYQAINDGKRVLDDLNSELMHHRFGADRESFHFGYDWVPEFREYRDFFEEVIQLPNLGDGASLFDAELSNRARQVRDKLMSMLLSDDETRALRELERISDYRNYRSYEIYKEPEGKPPIPLSQYGTGSGGQLETPAYIIRAAAITSAFRFSEGDSHLRMVLVDEAFSKMDETRSREVINYLTETLGLQLMFIMPTSKSGPFMDMISNQFVFTKCPTAQAVGELNTRVLVDRQLCNQDRIKELWANHRQQVRHQFSLDFMEAFVDA